MSVANGQIANQTTFNNAFVSRTQDTSTVGKIDLENTDSDDIQDAQRELNAIARYTGKSTNTPVETAPAWTDNTIGASGDSLFERIEAVQAEVISGGGGGGSVNIHNEDFTGTSITTTDDAFQKWAYTASSVQTMTAINASSLPNGGRLLLVGRSNDNILTIPTTLSDVIMNGSRDLALGSTIEFVKDSTSLVEVSRNGI